MNETAWLTIVAPDAMLAWATPRSSARKLRLLAAACCRQVAPLARAGWLEPVVLTVERIADGVEDPADQSPPALVAALRGDAAAHAFVRTLTGRSAAEAARAAAEWAEGVATRAGARLAEQWVRASLIVDVLGNPFQPAALLPAWRTDEVVSLARKLYESRDSSAIPVLADALQEAGCDSDAVLGHCRDRECVHVRGCWVVDLVLGKS